MGASQSEECEIPWFVQCDGHYIAREGSKSPHGWLRLEGHGSVSARPSEQRDETTFGTWKVRDERTVELVIAGVTYVMTAVDDVHNTVHIAATGDAAPDTFAFIDEEGVFANR